MKRDICLQIEGALLEKLLQQALTQGAVFARMDRASPRRIIVEGDAHSINLLRKLCRRYGYGCTLLRVSGKAALLERICRRWTLMPAIALGALLCALTLSRVWMVDVRFTGENAHLGDRAQVLACLRDCGVAAGMPRGRVDADILQKQISAQLSGISYAGIDLEGVRLSVQVSPEAPVPELYEIGYARDLVALRSGVIEEINVYSGLPCVKSGDTVLRGDTLIRGEEQVGKNNETGESITAPVGALGRVKARCWFEGSAEGALARTASVRTGNTRFSSRIALMGLSLPVRECEEFASGETETQSMPIVGLFLPLEIQRTTHYETIETSFRQDRASLEAQLLRLARADALKKICAEADAYEIRSCWADTDENNNTLRLRAVYEITTDIAVQRDALIKEVY